MSNKNEILIEELPDDEDFDDDDFDETDYGFIINADGSLKTMMIPEDLMDDPPIEIKRILKIFGIKNIHTLEPRTLH
jgi:hypothetical protein